MKIIVATSKNEVSAVVLTVWPVDVSLNSVEILNIRDVINRYGGL